MRVCVCTCPTPFYPFLTRFSCIILPSSGSYGQGTCRTSAYTVSEYECTTVGCHWDGGTCRQPLACDNVNNDRITYDGVTTGVRIDRYPISPGVAELCDADQECSAMYTLTLSQQWVTGNNCNDYAALPPHGVDQTVCEEKGFTGMMNYVGHPWPNDGLKQSIARGERSVTALTEEGYNCSSTQNPDGNPQCAFPLGFKTDTILKDKGICITVTNAQDKWIEIMASSREGSNGGSYCVRDRNAVKNQEEACTPSGDLIDIRESGISAGTKPLNLILEAQDNFDDAQIEVLWRITSSYMLSTDTDTGGATPQKDDEDWSLYRNGGAYPASLTQPYPEGYDGEPVFQQSTGTSGAWTASSVFMVFAAAVVSMFCI